MLKESYCKYIIYITLIIAYLFVNAYITHLINLNMESTYTITPIMIIYGETKYMVLGLILGLENIIREKKKEGNWKIHAKKLLIIGLPLLILAVLPYKLTMLTMQKDNTTIRIMSAVILGYITISSFYKSKNN